MWISSKRAREAQYWAKMRQLIFRIEADRIARHEEIRQLMAEFEEAHARRRQELDEIRAGVKSQMAGYKVWIREFREE